MGLDVMPRRSFSVSAWCLLALVVLALLPSCPGGLADTVTDMSERSIADGTATGFVFNEALPAALLEALRRAAATWRDKSLWERMQHTGMLRDFGWSRSARSYLDLYRATDRRPGIASFERFPELP